MGPTSGSNKGSVEGLRQGRRRLASFLIIIIISMSTTGVLWGATALLPLTGNETISVAAIGHASQSTMTRNSSSVASSFVNDAPASPLA